jgi:cohesin loading factor subunit SCC2
MNGKYLDSAKMSYNYQKAITGGSVFGTLSTVLYVLALILSLWTGYRMQPVPTAMLQRWYSLARDKRASRQDFLRATLKAFDFKGDLATSQVSSVCQCTLQENLPMAAV